MNTGRSRRGGKGVLARRRPQIAAVALGALLIASGLAVVKPRDYRAETTLRISGSKALAAEQLEQRVEAITRDVVAPQTLHGVATRLAADGLTSNRLRDRTDVGASLVEPGVWDVVIGHTAADPAAAARVVELLAADYQWSAVQGPIVAQEQAVDRQKKLVAATRDELATRSDELERYVHDNQSYLEGPEERLKAVRDQIGEVERVEIASYEGEIERLVVLLKEEPEFLVEESQVRDDDRIQDLRREIRDVEAELTVLQVEQNRTDAHPAVVAKRKILMDLKDELARVQSEVTTRKVETPNEMFASLAKAKIEAEADLARARRKLSVLRTKETELLEEVRRAPDLRGERDRLSLAVEAAQQALDERQAALTEAEEQLASLHAERPLQFETVEPPAIPQSPAGPGTLVIAGAGLLLGAFLGMGLACVADSRDKSFREPTRVSIDLGLPTLGAIDVIRTPAEERQLAAARRRTANTLVATGLAACALLGYALLGDATPLQDLVRSMLP